MSQRQSATGWRCECSSDVFSFTGLELSHGMIMWELNVCGECLTDANDAYGGKREEMIMQGLDSHSRHLRDLHAPQ